MTSILVADDDKVTRYVVANILKQKGYNITEAESAEEVLELFHTKPFDLILLDINLGKGKNGFQLCNEIKADPYGALIPVVLITSMGGEENLLTGFRSGANDYLRKPFTIDDLQQCVKQHLEKSQQQFQTMLNMGERQFRIGDIIEGKRDQYRIVRQIAFGGMGVVFHAISSNAEEVAIKTLNFSAVKSHKEVQRFLQEAQTTMGIEHPNLASAIEVVRTREHFFFVTKYIPGKDLEEIVEEQQLVSPRLALEVAYDITNGLCYLEEHGMVHRDIKPENIIITTTNAVLIDMGLTIDINQQSKLTTAGTVLGSPYFLSPEQVTGSEIDIRSDIYSLGLTMYRAITGILPYAEDEDDPIIEVINARLQSELPPVHLIRPQIPERVSQLLAKMTSCDPAKRHQTALELLDDISSCLSVLIS